MRSGHLLLILGLLISLGSCGSSKRSVGNAGYEISRESGEDRKEVKEVAFNIRENAKEYLGTRYRYGGTTREGMDCSGLVYTAFLEEGVSLPRISREMSLMGSPLYLREVNIGDLLFFGTDKNRKVINHVGLVVDIREEDIYFIHSTTSSGVIISSIKNPYWQEHFVMARRVL